MANEIDVKASLQINKNSAAYALVGNTRSDLTGDIVYANTQIIAASPGEAIVFGADILAAGIKIIGYKNLDTTKVITITDGDGVGHILNPGEAIILRPNVGAGVDPTHTGVASVAGAHLQVLAAGP